MSRFLLAIDTAAELCAVCVLDMESATVAAVARPEIGRGHAEHLMTVIADVLGEAGSGYGGLAKLAVTVGPGSFTGLRVGVAAARGLALALDIPAVGVTTLEALAAPHAGSHMPVLAILDARRGQVYAELFGASGAGGRGPAVLACEDLAGFVRGASGADGRLAVVGSGAAIARERLPAFDLRVLGIQSAPDILDVARIGHGRSAGAAPQPLYLRGADAKPQAPFAGLARRPGI